MKENHESLKQLFQQEFSKMVPVISKRFGLQHIEIAEDIVSETFLKAAELWDEKGIPQNPSAWLYAVAKQKMLYHLRRNKIYTDKVMPEMAAQQEKEAQIESSFSQENIKDSQLQMLFAICDPAIVSEAQIGLALRILCGFSIDEIAEAFLSNKETINKRLFRAKEKLREEKVQLVLPPEGELDKRLDNVLHILYLLFNEGYYSKTQDQILRKEFCFEALRLAVMLSDYERTNRPKTNALLALMCFHASRFDARQANEDVVILYEQQNEDLWDKRLIAQGRYFLGHSLTGNEVSSYHLEAKIASLHCIKEDTPEKWEEILQLYNDLLLINYSPSVALNRTFALYKANGRAAALVEAEKLRLENNHFYFLLLGELYSEGNKDRALANFKTALRLAKTQAEKEGIQKRINAVS
jgi:RNA polymerase sigma factor (sigma-70 family)